MAGKGITDLRRPPKRFNPVGTPDFETKKAKEAEDRTRARGLRKQAAETADPIMAAALQDLADRIDPKVTEDTQTIASARYMRKHRIRLTGALWELHIRRKGRPRRFTLMPRGMTFTPDQLIQQKPPQLLARVRAALIRAGAGIAVNGFLILGLHGEYDPLTGLFQIHFHGYGEGPLLAAVEGSKATDAPVQIRKSPLTNLPSPLSYIVQSWWPSRARGIGEDRLDHASPRRCRIPEPAHSQWLLWLDRWRLQDMVLMMRLRVVNGRLRVADTPKSRTRMV
jgi:hypothetical protein